MKKYLVTTALKELWPKKGYIWLLTPGCDDNYGQFDSEIEHNIKGTAPNPFESVQITRDSYADIQSITEDLIKILAVRLNKIHNTAHSEQYWRIHIGFWCIHYVSVIYDRYKRLMKATSNLPDITVIGCLEANLPITANTVDFVYEATDDFYNTHLYTFICRKLNIPLLCFDLSKTSSEPDKLKTFFLSSSRKLIRTVLTFFIDKITLFFAKKADVLMSSSYLPRSFELALLIKSRGKIVSIPSSIDKTVNHPPHKLIDETARSLLSVAPKQSDEIISLIFEMVGTCIPKLFVESYWELCSRSEYIYKNLSPRLIYSANSWWFDEPFKNWAARSGAKGVKLVGGEHGGAPFLDVYRQFESLEIAISDYYLSWGWTDFNEQKIIASPANKLIWFKNPKFNLSSKKITYITTAEARYSVGILEDFSSLLKWQQRFFTNIPVSLLDDILVRLHYCDYGWNIKNRLLKRFPVLIFDQWNVSFKRRLRESKMCIFDYLSTTFSESISANIPTVLFLDEKKYPINSDLFPFIKKLRDVNIIHDSPESAAAWVVEVYEDPYVWWLSKPCQDVVKDFCNLYAQTSNNPLKQWEDIFEKISTDS